MIAEYERAKIMERGGVAKQHAAARDFGQRVFGTRYGHSYVAGTTGTAKHASKSALARR